jgi:hypothetical protein
LLKLESLIDDAGNLDLAAVEVVNRGREHISLGERAQDGDFYCRVSATTSAAPKGELLTIAEDLRRRPAHTGGAGVDTVAHELATTADVVDRILEHLGAAGRLDDNVEAVRVVLLDLLPLGSGILAGQRDVEVSSVEALGQFHLLTLGGSDGQLGNTVEFEELREHETGGASANEKGVGAGLGGNLLKTVHGARGGLDEGGIDVAKVLDLEQATLGVVAVLGETTVEVQDTMGREVLAEELVAATAVEAVAAELRVVGSDTVANGEALDVVGHGNNLTNGLVSRNQGEFGNELALVDVKIGTADTASLDLDENIARSDLGDRNLDDAPVLRLLIPAQLALSAADFITTGAVSH